MICVPCSVTIWERAVCSRQTWSLSIRRRPKTLTLTLTLKFLWASINNNGRLSIISQTSALHVIRAFVEWAPMFLMFSRPFTSSSLECSFSHFCWCRLLMVVLVLLSKYSTIYDEEGFQQIHFAVSHELWSIRTELPSFWDFAMTLAPGGSMWGSLFLFWKWHF
jgi:hypothetical protein